MRTAVVSSTSIRRCPIRSIAADHYRDDGSCVCDDYKAWPDAELASLIDELAREVRMRQNGLAVALVVVANRAHVDAEAAVVVPPEALTLTYLAAHEDARRAKQYLLEARDRLAAAATERNRREGTIP